MFSDSDLQAVPFETELWDWEPAERRLTEHLGRECLYLESSTATVADVELVDGAIEVDLAVGPDRGFHGVVWRVQDDENFESFFVRPHQTGNPDAIQYTPVFNAISSWQLYHGEGFWAPIPFPLDEWFRIRVVFSGARAEIYVADLETPALRVRELKRRPEAGKVGVFVGGPPIHLSNFAYSPGELCARRAPARRVARGRSSRAGRSRTRSRRTRSPRASRADRGRTCRASRRASPTSRR